MQLPIQSAVAALYSGLGTLLALLYVPQICTIWRSRSGARDISLPAWSLWTVFAFITVCYALLVARDARFGAVSASNLVGCAAVTGVTAWKRYRTGDSCTRLPDKKAPRGKP